MGRQINFYMSNEIRAQFYNFLKKEGFLFLPTTSFEYFNDVIAEDVDISNEFFIYLYKKTYGKIIPTNNERNDKRFIMAMYNPVIDFKIPRVNDVEKLVYSGRIWLTSYDFYDVNASKKDITSDYNKIVRWIKKKVPYQDFEIKNGSSGVIRRWYINDDVAFKISEESYHINY